MNDLCKSRLKVTLLNVRSLKTVNRSMNKLVQLQNLAVCTDSDVIALTETWLNDKVASSEMLDESYVIYRCDRRTGSRGGGVWLSKNVWNLRWFCQRPQKVEL